MNEREERLQRQLETAHSALNEECATVAALRQQLAEKEADNRRLTRAFEVVSEGCRDRIEDIKSLELKLAEARAEVELLVEAKGASQFAYYDDHEKAVIQFVAHSRMIRFTLPLPKPMFGRNGEAQREKMIRSRWRALLLAIKAKYETIASGIAQFETEFLPHIVVGGNQTVADVVRPKIADLYLGGRPSGVLSLEFKPAQGGEGER